MPVAPDLPAAAVVTPPVAETPLPEAAPAVAEAAVAGVSAGGVAVQAPLPLVETPVVPAAAPIPEPIAPTVAPMAVASAPVHAAEPAPAPFDASAYAAHAGLQLVETRASAGAAPMEEPEHVTLGRPRRERAKPVAEELVQVETQK